MPADLSLDQESSAALNSTAVRGTTTVGVPVVRRGTVRSGVRGRVGGQGPVPSRAAMPVLTP